ncbi:glycosyltransferase family 1 protein [Candidatus Chloroploca sp. Khr17]|uniref:glycosyltransferase family 4 protein n=1 Tax=Candidatus Chloroploca sp. Khr17 TaxID=2496869 RepID=UPI0013E9F901|nr:glycosyltransferase family 1 protein [Candidatus Chloroploca sp. Khr17]
MISYGLDRAPGGIGRYTLELSAALRDAGVSLITLQAGGHSADPATLVLRGSRLLPALMTLGQVQIALAAHRHDLDLVHDPTGSAPLGLTSARRVATIHDVIPFVYPDTSTRLDWLIYRLWLPLVARRLDTIITDSQQSRSDLIRYLALKPERVKIIPMAAAPHYRPVSRTIVEQTLARLGIRAPYLLFVGSLEVRKNLTRLFEAYARLRTWSRQWTLVVVGARKLRQSPLSATVRRLGLEPNIHVTGYVAEEDLPALYSGADLFVFPSLYEGFGLPPLEAMACGTPVVTSNVSSLPEVVGDAALTVDPYDVTALARAMERALTDATLRTDLRAKGLARAAQFTWERTARETLEVYRQALNSR